MADNTELFDSHGRVIRAIVFNTAKDGSGTYYFPLLDSDGHLQVDALSAALSTGTNRIGTVSGVLKEVRRAKAIDASIGAYTAGDMVNDTDCCVTATPWVFPEVARANGASGYVVGAVLINETENQAVQYDLLLYKSTPTGLLEDNTPCPHPVKTDRSIYLGRIVFPTTVAKGAAIATVAIATPNTPASNLPFPFTCAAAADDLIGVLVTNTAYTQTATDDIEIALLVEQY